MSKWGKHLEFSEAELRAALDVTTTELMRQHFHHAVDPVLVSVIKKLASALHRITAQRRQANDESTRKD